MANSKPAPKPAKAPAKTGFSVADVLKKAATKSPGPSKRKDEKPVFNIAELHEPISSFLEAYKNSKDADAQMSAAEALILPTAELERLKFCQEEGKLESTVKLQAPAGVVAISVQNKYSKIDPEKEPQLRGIFGDENFDKFFATKTEVSLNEAAFKDEGVIAKVIEAVGQENFDRYFKVKQYLDVNDTFHQARSTDAALQAQFEDAASQELLRCNKASCKPS